MSKAWRGPRRVMRWSDTAKTCTARKSAMVRRFLSHPRLHVAILRPPGGERCGVTPVERAQYPGNEYGRRQQSSTERREASLTLYPPWLEATRDPHGRFIHADRLPSLARQAQGYLTGTYGGRSTCGARNAGT
jgi:hypothetical protein